MHDAAHRLVYLVDGDDFSRKITADLLGKAGFLVRECDGGGALLRGGAFADNACILLDLNLRDCSAMQVLRAIQAQTPAPFVIVTAENGPVTAAVQAMKLGALDFLVKPLAGARLLQSLDEAFRQLASRKRSLDSLREAQTRLGCLTRREKDVLCGLVHGKANKVIAHCLGISPRTVEIHRANLMSKLGAANLSEVLRIAFTAGITAINDEPDENISGREAAA
ncbi:MAG TPA: LuxR C-terminal-related transcriptional regulator [Allosphingosinicella sp.]